MDTLQFLTLVMPDEPVLYAVEKRARGMAHAEQTSLQGLAAYVTSKSAKTDVYFALASYAQKELVLGGDGQPLYNSRGNPKYRYRTQEQVRRLKSFWLDVDAGEGKDYPDKHTALKELATFIAKAGLPKPLIVDSGNGLHVYWPLTDVVEVGEWREVASALKRACEVLKFKADPARTADPASILRPVGTYNHKTNPPMLVRALTVGGVTQVTLDTMRDALLPYIVEQAEDTYVEGETDSPLNDLLPQPKADPEVIAQRCAVMGKCASLRGNVSEPLWRGMLGVLKFCHNGVQYAHAWSSGHPQYSPAETEEKLARYKGGPTTCEYFSGIESDLCAQCQFRGQIKTPLQVGRSIGETDTPEQAPVVEVKEVTLPDGSTRAVDKPLEVPDMPDGFVLANGHMYAVQKDDSGEVKHVAFSSLVWFPYARIRRDDGTFAYRCKVIKNGVVSEFELEASDLASPANTLERLAGMEIYAVNKKARDLMLRYAVKYCTNMVGSVKPVHTYDQFGWDQHMDGFVLGNMYITAEGIEQCILAGNAEAKASAFTKLKTDTTPWVTAVDTLYNRPDMLPMQYALLSGFGSLLGRFIHGDAYAGIPCALTSSDSGIGKTTVAKLALAAFGDWREMFLSSTGGATKLARISTISTMGNLPVLLDELTDIPPAELVELLYSISNGRERQRLEQTGALRKTASWNSSVYITANENLINKLSAMRVDTEANQVRVFEIDLTTYLIPKLDPSMVDKMVEQALRDRGAVGLKYIEYLVRNKAKVDSLLHTIEKRLMQAPVFSQPRLRFYRYHAVCTLAAGYILQELGMHKFNMDGIMDWAVKHVKTLANTVQDNKIENSSGENLIDELIRSLSGNGNLLYTATYGRRGQGAIVLQEPKNELKARLIGTPAGEAKSRYDGSLLIVKSALKDWCSNRRMSIAEFFARLPEGTVKSEELNTKLSAYTDIPAAVSRCVWLDVKGLINLEEPLEEATV